MVAIHAYHNDSDGTSGSESGDDTAPNNNNNSPNASTSSWRGWKERGKQAYLRGEYASALQGYSQALQRRHNFSSNNFSSSNSSSSNNNNNNNFSSNNNNIRDFSFPSRLDQQILLSNMVACRLKLGGVPQAEAAVATAQKCIAINHKWAKGHFRLAEAYLSLARSYENETESSSNITNDENGNDTGNDLASQKRLECSNKACEALQKVIDLDPGNQNQSARNMLTKELRYCTVGSESRNNSNGNNNNNNNNYVDNGTPEPSAPPEHMDENQSNSGNNNDNDNNNDNNNDNDNDNTSNNSNQRQSRRINNNNDNSSNTVDDIDIEDDDNYDYTPSWQDRLAFRMQRIRAWYLGLCEDDKVLVKLAVVFVVLYVAFGGRFGLEYYGKNNRATPPGRSNAVYEDFYKSRNENHYNHHSSNSYDRYGGDSSRASSSSSAWGGYYSYTMVVGAVACIAQRFFGVSPYQAIFFVTTLMGRRGGRVFPRRRYGGWGGMGLGGGGGGFGNYNFRHRRGGMWGR